MVKPRYKDLTGLRFGRLYVNAYAGSDKFQHATWDCSCDCGKGLITTGIRLSAGKTTSCGCYNKERTKEALSKPTAYLNRIYRNCASGAEVRGYSFELTKEQYKELVVKPCHYCGRAPYEPRFWARHDNGAFNCNGIDRRDNSLGYTLENSVPCCSRCNVAKMDYTEQEFLETVRLIYEFRIKDNPSNETRRA